MKAYLVHLSGQGDNEVYILNKEDFNFLVNGGEPPASMVEHLAKEYEMTKIATKEMLVSFTGSSIDNDRALSLRGSLFNGKRYHKDYLDPADIMKFVNKHNLNLDKDTWEGAIY